MSLPAALLQRLKKRGLVTKQSGKYKDQYRIQKEDNQLQLSTGAAPISEAIEEIIAENYDDDDKSGPYPYKEDTSPEPKRRSVEEKFWSHRIKERIGVNESYHGYKLCPNKYNIYHKCSLYCVNKFNSSPLSQPSHRYLKRYKRLLRKYPLEAGWKDVYDKGCKAFYFYNSTTQTVSWLPPSHPKARITNSAAVFRRQLANSNDEFNFDTNMVQPKSSNQNEPDEPDVFVPAKKQKSRDLERKIQRRRRNDN